jgi:thioredoxin-related protein
LKTGNNQKFKLFILKYIARILSIWILISFCYSVQSQVAFINDDFEALVARADSAGKNLMVDAYTDWCGWCKVMDQETFNDTLVGEFINGQFISTKINMEENFGLSLAMKYRVSQYPQYLFFNGKGELLARLSGYMEPATFIERVTNALKPENQLPPLPHALDFELDYPDFYKNSFQKRKDRVTPQLIEIQSFLESRDSLTDEVSWGVLSRFVSGGQFADSVIANKEVLISRFGKEEVVDKLASFVFQGVKQAIKDSSELLLNESLVLADEILGTEAPKYTYRYRLYFFQMRNDWASYARIASEMSRESGLAQPDDLNQMAKAVYLNTNKPEAISSAKNWMESLLEQNREYDYLETYTVLLERLGRREESLKIAEEARELAIEQGIDLTVITEIIDGLQKTD